MFPDYRLELGVPRWLAEPWGPFLLRPQRSRRLKAGASVAKNSLQSSRKAVWSRKALFRETA